MRKLEIIATQKKPTPWVSSLTYWKKANIKLHIFLHPKDMNNMIIRNSHKASNLKEIMFNVAGKNMYSKLNAEKGFLSLHWDHEISLLATFNTHVGHYRFLGMHFRLKMSQGISQIHMDQEVSRSHWYPQQHIQYGKSKEEHDQNLLMIMIMARKNGLVFNRKKCELKCRQISFNWCFLEIKGWSQIWPRYNI